MTGPAPAQAAARPDKPTAGKSAEDVIGAGQASGSSNNSSSSSTSTSTSGCGVAQQQTSSRGSIKSFASVAKASMHLYIHV
jgi:membrane protein involved in colicin uptake